MWWWCNPHKTKTYNTTRISNIIYWKFVLLRSKIIKKLLEKESIKNKNIVKLNIIISNSLNKLVDQIIPPL